MLSKHLVTKGQWPEDSSPTCRCEGLLGVSGGGKLGGSRKLQDPKTKGATLEGAAGDNFTNVTTCSWIKTVPRRSSWKGSPILTPPLEVFGKQLSHHPGFSPSCSARNETIMGSDPGRVSGCYSRKCGQSSHARSLDCPRQGPLDLSYQGVTWLW